MWVLNSAALRIAGIDSDDGLLLGDDALVRSAAPAIELDMSSVGIELARFGVTGVTDMTPSTGVDELSFLARLVTPPEFPLRVVVTGGPGVAAAEVPGLVRGPVKIVVGDHDLPSIDQLVHACRTARANRRAVAIHCVTRVALVLTVAALQEVGTVEGDRIEHGAVIPLEMIDSIRELGVTVVTQPSFVRDRGDQYLIDVDADDIDHLWRCGSLIDAGIPVGGSTDAPYGDPDPWRAIAAATQRETVSGASLGASERIDARRALDLFLGDPHRPGGPVRRVAVGGSADLCLLGLPLAAALRSPASDVVVAAFGRTVTVTRS
jgi:predicted amidohydrolase YtcJ